MPTKNPDMVGNAHPTLKLMPLEIRELVIKSSVNEGGQGQNVNPGEAGGNFDADTQAAIIAACVEQVLAILKEKSER